MPVPAPHRSPTADRELAWDWAGNAAWFQPDDYQLDLPAEEVPDVYEHLAVHLEEFGEKRPDILKGWAPRDGWPPR